MWLNLALVCRRWRAVMFASCFRLDMTITLGPQKPGHIKKILSSPLPIFIEYKCFWADITGSALWRMRAALRYRDRVREIIIGRCSHSLHAPLEESITSFGKFIRAANYRFPALERLVLNCPYGHEPDIPTTFLRGPNKLDLPLRRLELYGFPSIVSMSGLLLSAAALTDFTLCGPFTTDFKSDSLEGLSLLACLQGMQCLHSLNLRIPHCSQSQHETSKNIVPLSQLTRFHYSGPTILLNNLISGLSAPSLKDAHFVLRIRSPLLYLSRLIDDVSEEFRSVGVTLDTENFDLLSSTYMGKIDRFKQSFMMRVDSPSDSIKSINSTLSTKLAMAEELALYFPRSHLKEWDSREHVFSMREFLHQFRSVRVLRVFYCMQEVAFYLQQDDGMAVMPALEEIEISTTVLLDSDSERQRREAEGMAAFEPFVSARERAGRVVKVSHSKDPWVYSPYF